MEHFDFASSNELWRASLDTIDFMPLSSVNYSGGIIITDWYSNNQNPNESIKISIRFLTNEIRSDALDIKVFTKKCDNGLKNCMKLNEIDGVIIPELNKKNFKNCNNLSKRKVIKQRKKIKTINILIWINTQWIDIILKVTEEKWQKFGKKKKSFSKSR